MSSSESVSGLTKSHSSSSLLLNNANLGWTQPSTGILVTPQPAIETVVTTTSQSNQELVHSLRTTSSESQLRGLDNFQTISLENNSTNSTINSSLDLNFDSIPDYLLGLKQLSLEGRLQTSSSVTNNSTKTSIVNTNMPSPANYLTHSSNEANLRDNNNENMSQLQTSQDTTALSPPYSQPSYSSAHSSGTQQSVNYYPETISSLPIPQSLPQQQSSTPLQPPKGLVTRDYKIKGPLRLYDPSHGIQNQTNTTPDISQAITTNCSPPTMPYSPPLIHNPNESLYNQSQHYVGGEQSLYNPQEYDTNSSHTIDSNQYSFISPTNESINTNEWIQNQQMMSQTNSNPSADGFDQYANNFNTYTPVVYHWFYQKIIENREVWTPFTALDSYNLEQAFIQSDNYGYGVVVATDGGRFDVNIYERLRRPVYWSEPPTIVRRCSWFYKNEGHNRYAPYPEDFSAKLEDSFRDSVINNRWNQRIEFPGQEVVVMHSYQSIYHYQLDLSMPDGWGSALENPVRPRHVQRGAHQIFDIEEGEPQQIDHLVFLIHGIGEICDFRFRSIVEVVDDFRAISLSLTRSHYKQYLDCGQLGRIELLPISWHSALHGEETGIDERLKLITLQSIPKLRHFSNDTILDALFYTSPLYCQTIVDNVGSEINRLFGLFKSRNPNFRGSVALGGHSLGSLIVFDILAHQLSKDINENSGINDTKTLKSDISSEGFKLTDINDVESLLLYLQFSDYLPVFQNQKLDFEALLLLTEGDLQRLELPLGLQKKLLSFIEDYKQLINANVTSNTKQNQSSGRPLNSSRKSSIQSISYAFESMGIGFPSINYPKLDFNPSAFFAMGSPIPMFLTVRGIGTIGIDFQLPTCPAFYNIFHPYDPIAYRIEPMIDPSFKDIKPVLIPHHKGRKRMHLELKESITRMGSDLKQKFFDSIKYTWNSISEFARAHKQIGSSERTQDIDSTVNQIIEEEICRQDEEQDQNLNFGFDSCSNLRVGSLNGGRRIDYVLQEKPIEIFNEYLFAMASHACYWESEDTCLVILRELYGQMGFNSLPQQQQNQSQAQANSSQAFNQNFIEQQFDNQLIHTNFQ